jgi:ABC-2 type transport system permease protein
MTSLGYALHDSGTMLRRNLKHMRRYPSLTILVAMLPIIFLLLFVYVFGGTLGAGIGGPSGGRGDYIAYVVPGILLMTVAGGAQGTAITVAKDMTEGIIARFRTMSISRGAVLTGHVAGNLLQGLITLFIVAAVAFAVGFRPGAGLLGCLGALGLLTMVSFALTWLSVALGMTARSVETASNLPAPLVLLPFLGSGFVPTTSLPAGLRQFAEYQPFTPFIEALRGLLTGGPVAGHLLVSAAWCAGIALVGYLWSRNRYNRDPGH